jgi:hypothetical protein
MKHRLWQAEQRISHEMKESAMYIFVYYDRINNLTLQKWSRQNSNLRSRVKSDEHANLRCCGKLIKQKSAQCTHANREIGFLLEMGDTSLKLKLRLPVSLVHAQTAP